MDTNADARRYTELMPQNGSVSDTAQQLLAQLGYVELHFDGRTSLVGAELTDPGTVGWHATATINVWPSDAPEERWHALPGVSLISTDHGDGGRELVMFEADGLVVDLVQVEDPTETLDARSEDYARFIPLFGEGRTLSSADLADDLADRLECLGSQVVIIDRVRLAPA
ncbi:hypothetical protein [Crossiella cryophila]|uniref:Uncharacterized protein n=1 Tax=Crossiella cryophila TaxID=43355 RepID=A0A7W7CA93_9PSEU|nr:hypothetical protein [Crossiella cryophila]MBB4677429.1 hypothetical protein [Crossiella cryophila]